MRTTLEPEDIQAIAGAVMELLRPMLSGNGKASEPDTIMTIDETAIFLNLYKKDKKPNIAQIYQWVNNSQHGLGTFPYLKAGKLLRFSKKALLKWLESR